MGNGKKIKSVPIPNRDNPQSSFKVPRHIAIIMDGNGRWAQKRGLPRVFGHREGIRSVREIVEECARDPHVKYLTLYAFSKENWKRPKGEVQTLMRFMVRFLRSERANLMKNEVKVLSIGEVEDLPLEARRELERTELATRGNRKLTLVLALSYGGRSEILRAAKGVGRELASGNISEDEIDEKRFERYLYTDGIPDPDLVIRTAGEMRLSNFLLWQASYAEIYVTDVLWPDFRKDQLHQAISDYGRRVRKFGGLPEKSGELSVENRE